MAHKAVLAQVNLLMTAYTTQSSVLVPIFITKVSTGCQSDLTNKHLTPPTTHDMLSTFIHPPSAFLLYSPLPPTLPHPHRNPPIPPPPPPSNLFPTYCPPSGRSRPMRRSWGLSKAVKTAKLAGLPEYGCTLTPHFSGSSLKASSALFWHSRSMSSMNVLPP